MEGVEVVELYLAFMEMAKKDLEAAKCLLERRLYPLAVFHVQQCVEKTVKFLLLLIGWMNEKEMKEIGHSPVKLCRKILEALRRELDKAGEVEKRLLESIIKPALSELIINLKPEACKVKEKELWEYSLSEEKLNSVMETFRQINKVISESVENLEKTLPERTEVYTPQFEIILRKIIIYRLIGSSAILLYLFLVFYPHVTRSRYPEKGFNPLDVYNKEMPLVQMLDSFIRIIENVLRDLEHTYGELTALKEDFNASITR